MFTCVAFDAKLKLLNYCCLRQVIYYSTFVFNATPINIRAHYKNTKVCISSITPWRNKSLLRKVRKTKPWCCFSRPIDWVFVSYYFNVLQGRSNLNFLTILVLIIQLFKIHPYLTSYTVAMVTDNGEDSKYQSNTFWIIPSFRN